MLSDLPFKLLVRLYCSVDRVVDVALLGCHHAGVLVFVLGLDIGQPNLIFILLRVNLFKLSLAELPVLEHQSTLLGLLSFLAA